MKRLHCDAEEPSQRSTAPKVLGDDEAALYDRQIRLWGAAAQQRLMDSAVVFVGISGVGARWCADEWCALCAHCKGSRRGHQERCAGRRRARAGAWPPSCFVGFALSPRDQLADDALVSERDLAANFLLPRHGSVGCNRAAACAPAAQELNPRVRVEVLEAGADAVAVEQFAVVIASGCGAHTLLALNERCRLRGTIFFVAATHGFLGYVFSDASGHQYRLEERKHETHTVQHAPSLTQLVGDASILDWAALTANRRQRVSPTAFALLCLWRAQLDGAVDVTAATLCAVRDRLCAQAGVVQPAGVVADAELARLARMVRGELSPVCAVTGGVAGQHIIRVLTGTGAPLDNLFVFDDGAHIGKVELLHREDVRAHKRAAASSVAASVATTIVEPTSKTVEEVL